MRPALGDANAEGPCVYQGDSLRNINSGPRQRLSDGQRNLPPYGEPSTPWASGTNGPASMQAWATGSGVERCDILLGSLRYLACIGYAPLV